METQKTSNSQSNLEKEEWNWKNQPALLQIILQSYSHQDSMVLAQKQKQMNGFISGLFILFHLYIYILSLCQYHTVLMTVALLYSLKSGRLLPPVPFFFLEIPLAIRGFLCFHTNCAIICSSSVKNTIGSLTGIALNL